MSKAGDGRDTYSYTLHFVGGKCCRNRAYFTSSEVASRFFCALGKRTARIEPYKTGWRVLWE